jgi:hypothetical protein
MLEDQLANFKKQLAAGGKGKKAKGKKKGKGKKGAKGKKAKPLPGAKLCGTVVGAHALLPPPPPHTVPISLLVMFLFVHWCYDVVVAVVVVPAGSMDVDHMLSILVENKIVNNVRPRSVSELRGTFNYLGSAYQVGPPAGS